MGGWGEVGLKVAQGGGLYIFFLLRGFGHEMAFGRKKPMNFFGKESGHSLQPCKIGIECLERIGLIHDTIHPFSFHWIQITWPFWKHRGVSQHFFGRGFGHCLPNLTHALVEDVYTDWHSQLGHVQPLFHFLEVPFCDAIFVNLIC